MRILGWLLIFAQCLSIYGSYYSFSHGASSQFLPIISFQNLELFGLTVASCLGYYLWAITGVLLLILDRKRRKKGWRPKAPVNFEENLELMRKKREEKETSVVSATDTVETISGSAESAVAVEAAPTETAEGNEENLPKTAVPSGRICSKCKKPIPDGATFCPACGKKYLEKEEPRPVVIERKKFFVIVTCICLIFMLSLGGNVYQYINAKNTPADEEDYYYVINTTTAAFYHNRNCKSVKSSLNSFSKKSMTYIEQQELKPCPYCI